MSRAHRIIDGVRVERTDRPGYYMLMVGDRFIGDIKSPGEAERRDWTFSPDFEGRAASLEEAVKKTLALFREHARGDDEDDDYAPPENWRQEPVRPQTLKERVIEVMRDMKDYKVRSLARRLKTSEFYIRMAIDGARTMSDRDPTVPYIHNVGRNMFSMKRKPR